jgi:hypothetical protein
MRTRLALVSALFLLVVALPSRSYAAHHLWRFSELFSNASGSTQFVELFCNADGEPNVGPFTVVSGGNTFSFNNVNLPRSTTLNTWILLATSNFASLPGAVPPDYIIPPNFFATGGGNINYASGIDSWNYGTVPTDGLHSLLKDGTTAVNSPTNFATGASGSVNLAAPVPAFPKLAIAIFTGLLLLIGSGLLRRRRHPTAAA